MKYIKIIGLFLLLPLIFSCSTARKATADKETLVWRYEIEPTVGQATQGSVLVKVWTYSKDKNVATMQAGKNAVHGVLFKGVAALNEDGARVPMQKPIVQTSDAESKYSEYFTTFFSDGGKYQKFVNFVNNGVPSAGDIIQIKKEYKVGIVVSVSKDALRKEMESAGIINSLSTGF